MIKGNLETLKTVISNYNFITLEAPNECYGNLMIDTDDGEVWTDEFCDFTHNEYKVYNDDAIHDVIQDYRWENPCWENMYPRKYSVEEIVKFCKKYYGVEFI